MTALPESDELRALAQDAIPSQREQCADHLGIPLDEVGEVQMMQFYDWLRDCEEMAGV